MNRFARRAHRFLASESGATAVEYAVMLAMIMVAALVGLRAMGTASAESFNTVANTMETALEDRAQ